MVDIQLQTEIVLETEDRVGVVAEVSRLLSDMGINVISIVVAQDGDRATLRLVTGCQSHAFEALKAAGFSPRERRVILMEIPHHPGFLSRMGEALARKGIAIEELHATVSDDSPTGLVVLRCSDNGNAVLLLRGK